MSHTGAADCFNKRFFNNAVFNIEVNGKIEITKNVVVDGVKKTVDDKFYATVFDDSGKAVSTVELKQNDKVTVTVPFSEDIKDTVTYAVKETE